MARSPLYWRSSRLTRSTSPSLRSCVKVDISSAAHTMTKPALRVFSPEREEGRRRAMPGHAPVRRCSCSDASPNERVRCLWATVSAWRGDRRDRGASVPARSPISALPHKDQAYRHRDWCDSEWALRPAQRFLSRRCVVRQVHLSGPRTTFFDFDGCFDGPLIADLVPQIAWLWHANQPEFPALVRLLLNAYASLSPLSDADVAAIPPLVQLHEICSIAFLVRYRLHPR